MAVSVRPVSTQYLYTSNPPNFNGSYTIAGWCRIDSDTNTYATFFNIQNADGNVDNLATLSDGTTLELYCNGGTGGVVSGTGTNLTVGTWYYLAIIRSGSSIISYVNGTQDVSLTHVTTNRNSTTYLNLGAWTGTTDYLNGSYGGVKVWTAAISVAELNNEMYAVAPRRLDNLHLWYPMFPIASGPGVQDYGASKSDLTYPFGYTTAHSPSVSWGTLPLVILYSPVSTDLNVNVSDGATVGESLTVQHELDLIVDRAEGSTVGEAYTVTLIDQDVLAVSVLEDVTLGEVSVASLPDALALSVADGAAVGESLNVSIAAVDLHMIAVGDGFSDGTGQNFVRTSDNRLWIATWKFDTYPSGGIGGGTGQTLRMYKADQTGVPSSFTRMDSTNEPAGVTSWAVAVDNNDMIHVIWSVRSSWTPPGDLDYIRYCIFNTSSGTWGTVETIESNMNDWENGQGDEYVSIVMDGGGKPHIVYLKGDGNYPRRRVTYREKTGASWSSPTTIDDQTFGANERCWHPGIFFDTSERICVTWYKGTTEGASDNRAFIRVYSGGSWGTTHEITATTGYTGIDTIARLYIDSNNRYHFCFLNSSKQIQYRYSDDQGATWSQNSPSGGTVTGDDPAVGPGANGKVRIYAHGPFTINITYWEGDGGSASWGTRQDYITPDGYDCTVNIRQTRHFWNYPQWRDVIYWKSDYPTNTLKLGIEVDGVDSMGVDVLSIGESVSVEMGILPDLSVAVVPENSAYFVPGVKVYGA